MASSSLQLERWVLASMPVLTAMLFLPAAADPVNVIKLTALLLGALLVLSCAAVRITRHRTLSLPRTWAAAAAGALLLAFVVSTAVAPVTTIAVLGAYGRNSGLLAYSAAIVLFLACLRAFRPKNLWALVAGVALAGLLSASYGLLQLMGVDAIAWNNRFNPIIAALGNPNFASGYVGIVAPVALGGALWTGWTRAARVACGITAALCLVAAVLSEAVQGPIAAAAGVTVVGAAVALESTSPRRRLWLGALAAAVAAGFATLLAGALGKVGPAAAFFSGISYDARSWYWQAAVDMFRLEPVAGVGLDHYGSYWRLTRPVESVAGLGSEGFSDSAHSVPLQMLAQGGLVLSLSYAAFVLTVLAALVLGLRRLRGPQRVLLGALGGGWLAYQTQSVVSIDQVPLITLHFLLAGGIVVASGTMSTSTLRLPGALEPVEAPVPGKGRSRRPVRVQPRERELTAVDMTAFAVIGILTVLVMVPLLAPLRANISMRTGDLQLAAGDGNAALDSFQKSADLVPGLAIHWLRQGALLVQVQQDALALEPYREAVERDPLDVNARKNLAQVAERLGDLDLARQNYQRIVELDPVDPESLAEAARFELRHSGAEAARALLEDAVRVLPEQALLWAVLGDARLVLGDVEGARTAYDQALALQPDEPTALAGLDKLDEQG